MKVLVLYEWTRGRLDRQVFETDGKMIECKRPEDILDTFLRSIQKERYNSVKVTGYLTERGGPRW